MKISTQRLRNAEFYQLITDLIKLIKHNAVLNQLLSSLLVPLETGLTDMSKIFNQSKTNILTFDLSKLDSARDRIFHAIELLVEAYQAHPTPEKAAAAEEIALHLKSYGKTIASQSYNEESANLHNLLDDFAEGAALKTAADNIPDLPDWLAELSRLNEKFQEKYLEREAVKGDSLPYNMKEKREEMSVDYKKLIQHIEAHAVLQPDNEELQQGVQQIDTLQATYLTIIKQRKKQKTGLEEEDEPEIRNLPTEETNS